MKIYNMRNYHHLNSWSEFNFKDLLFVVLFFSLILVPYYLHYIYHREIEGIPDIVTSSNTFIMNNTQIKLLNTKVEAVEASKRELAVNYLKEMVYGKNIKCAWRKRDRNNFLVSRCTIGAIDVAKKMAEKGFLRLTN